MIVSVHLPKTAGSSLRLVLEQHFGSRLLLDYADLPINTPADIRNQKAEEYAASLGNQDYGSYGCIHGHFLPAKYLPLKSFRKAVFVTWLRDPFERMLSHFNFWLRTYEPGASPAFHRRVVEEQWSFEKFSLSVEMRNFYAQFLWHFPVSNFDFVGITEHYDEDIRFFAREFLGMSLTAVPRVNTAIPNPLHIGACEYDELRLRFAEAHLEDVQIYAAALALRRQRAPRSRVPHASHPD